MTESVSFNIDERPIHCMHCGTDGKAIINKGFNELLSNQNK